MTEKPTYQDLEKRIQELERNEEYYRLITVNSTDMISKHDPDGVFTYASPAFRGFLGYDPEELIGRNAYEFFHPEDLEPIQKSHREIQNAPIIYTVPYRFRHKQGHYVWVEATSKTIRNPSTGDIEEIIATTRDITVRKQMEEALARSAEFKGLIGGISTEFLGLSSEKIDRGIERALASIGAFSGADRAYVFLYRKDAAWIDNTHEWCTEGIEPRIEYRKGILINERLPWFADRINKREIFVIPDVADLPMDACKEREHSEAFGIQSVIVVPMALGDRLLGFIGFDAVKDKRCWRDDDLSILKLFGEIFASALERKRTEEQLRESEERWAFALEGAGDGVWDWDAATNRVYLSKQWKAMLGYAEHEIGDTYDEWESRVHPDDLAGVREDLDRHFTGISGVYQNEHRLLCRDGSYKWVLDRGKILEWTEDGKPKRFIGTHSDISERKKAEAERMRLISELESALAKVKTLSGLLPICSVCKKIRDDKGYWNQIEAYIQEHSDAQFSHGICQECAKKYYAEFHLDKG